MDTLIEDLRAIHTLVNQKWYKFSSDIADAFGNEKEFTDLETFPKIRFDIFNHWFGEPAKEQKLNREFIGFAQMGEGSTAAIWLLEGADLETSPVVLIGSEGEVGVIAPNYYDFMMLSGQGFGMYELLENAIVPGCDPCEPFMQFMQQEFKVAPITNVGEVIKKAKADNPDLEAYLF